MILTVTPDAVFSALRNAGIICDYEKAAEENLVTEKDHPFLTYIQAETMLAALSGCMKILEKQKDSSLDALLTIDNPNFTVEKKVTKSDVSTDTLRRIRPDIYNQVRKLEDKFIHRRFSPYDLIRIFKNAGVTEEEVCGNCSVNVGDVRELLSEAEIDRVVYPVKYKYVVSEVRQ